MRRAKISIDDPRAVDVRALLERHLEFANSHSPPGRASHFGQEAAIALLEPLTP